MNDLALVPQVSLGGSAMSADLLRNLIDLRVDRALNVSGRCTITFAATPPDNFLEPGQKVVVKSPDGKHVLFDGELAAAEVEIQHEALPVTTLVAYDLTHRMARSGGTETYLEKTDGDIVKSLTGKHAVSVESSSITNKYEYVLQTGTDLDLLDDLVARAGADWWWDAKGIRIKELGPAGTATVKRSIADLRRFAVRASVVRPDATTVSGWNTVTQKEEKSEAKLSAQMLPTDASLPKSLATKGFRTQTARPIGVAVTTSGEAKMLAESLQRSAANAAIRAEGEGADLWELLPGRALELTDADATKLSGKYLITAVEHRYDPDLGGSTHFVSGERRAPKLAGDGGGDTSAETTFRHLGLMVGEVTNIKDPKKLARVKVRLIGMASEKESTWARVLVIGAGKDRGSVLLPEVGDEVLVAFEGGDLRKPVVLGGLYGDKQGQALWYTKDGKVTARRTTSRLGHILEFGDGTGKADQHIVLMLADGANLLRLGADESTLQVKAGNKLEITVGSQSSIVFDGNGKITFKGTDIAFEATSNFKVEANAQVEIKGTAGAKLEGTTLDLKGSAKGTLDGGGMLEVKGGLVKIN